MPPRAKSGAVADVATVKSLDKAIDILRTLGGVPEGMSLGDVALMNGLPKTTAHRLLTALQGRQFVRYDQTLRIWKIGIEAFVVGSAFLRNRDFVEIGRPILKMLARDTGETASLYMEDDCEIVCLSQIESRHIMRVIARPGGRADMHSSGAGKAILAHWPAERINELIEKRGLPGSTEKTVSTPQALRKELAEVKAASYAIDDEENALGIRCVAAALFDHTREPIGAISISGPATRVTQDRFMPLGQRVREAADIFTRSIGG